MVSCQQKHRRKTHTAIYPLLATGNCRSDNCWYRRGAAGRKVPRIGFLDSSAASGIAVLLNVLRKELSKFGWIEGKNITIEYRSAEHKNEGLPELAAELVRLKLI